MQLISVRGTRVVVSLLTHRYRECEPWFDDERMV